MQLGVMGAHDCAIVADQLFARIAEVSQRLIVQEALLFQDWIHLIGARVRVAASSHRCTPEHRTERRLRHVAVERHRRTGVRIGRWGFRLLFSRCLSRRGVTYLDALCALGLLPVSLGRFTVTD
jgi:hypothetical protein